MMKTMVRQVFPLQSMEVHSGADLHLQPVEDSMLEQVDAPKGSCDPVGSPTLEQSSAKTCGPVERGDHTGAVFLTGLVTPWGTHAGVACS